MNPLTIVDSDELYQNFFWFLACVERHASETWLLTKPNSLPLQGSNWAMIRQICNIKSEDMVSVRSRELLVKLWSHLRERKGFSGMDI